VKIALLEPFMTGSHAAWAEGYAASSRHQVEIFSLEGKYWKWRMHGGALTLARQFLASGFRPDLILATDMLDLTTFLALTRQVTPRIPCAVYFHENQLSYPWSPDDADPVLQRDAHYCFINFTTALSADMVCFNSAYHQRDFLEQLPVFLGGFPDHSEVTQVKEVAHKSLILPLGLDLEQLDKYRACNRGQGSDSLKPDVPLILWNHRWEYDKNPEEFFRALFVLQDQGVEFKLAVLGESYQRQPPIFREARERLGTHIAHWGYVESYAEYAAWLWRADILPVTSVHDFFGISVVEALYCGCEPLLPRRLAYPEHVPAELHARCFYTDFDDLVRRLVRTCQSRSAESGVQIRTHVADYAWGHMAPRYDELFSGLAAF
jgi:glycosyltransferase involved in cell wall biosynthesis